MENAQSIDGLRKSSINRVYTENPEVNQLEDQHAVTRSSLTLTTVSPENLPKTPAKDPIQIGTSTSTSAANTGTPPKETTEIGTTTSAVNTGKKTVSTHQPPTPVPTEKLSNHQSHLERRLQKTHNLHLPRKVAKTSE